VNNLQLFEVVASAIVFQFVSANKDLQITERVLPYYDKLNSWLGQILQRDIDNVQIELCDIEQCGVAIRICPLENFDQPPTSEDIENLVTCLEQQIVRITSAIFLLDLKREICDSVFFSLPTIICTLTNFLATFNIKNTVVM